jgi:hypothetical protein
VMVPRPSRAAVILVTVSQSSSMMRIVFIVKSIRTGAQRRTYLKPSNSMFYCNQYSIVEYICQYFDDFVKNVSKYGSVKPPCKPLPLFAPARLSLEVR